MPESLHFNYKEYSFINQGFFENNNKKKPMDINPMGFAW